MLKEEGKSHRNTLQSLYESIARTYATQSCQLAHSLSRIGGSMMRESGNMDPMD